MKPHYNPTVLEVDHPQCDSCAGRMRLISHLERSTHDEYTFECKTCGTTLIKAVRSES
jgi:uncharacterized Zn finger protein